MKSFAFQLFIFLVSFNSIDTIAGTNPPASRSLEVLKLETKFEPEESLVLEKVGTPKSNFFFAVVNRGQAPLIRKSITQSMYLNWRKELKKNLVHQFPTICPHPYHWSEQKTSKEVKFSFCPVHARRSNMKSLDQTVKQIVDFLKETPVIKSGKTNV